MTGETLIQLALGLPTAGAVAIALTGFNRNLRETVTMLTAGALFWVVVLNLLPMILNGERPEWSRRKSSAASKSLSASNRWACCSHASPRHSGS